MQVPAQHDLDPVNLHLTYRCPRLPLTKNSLLGVPPERLQCSGEVLPGNAHEVEKLPDHQLRIGDKVIKQYDLGWKTEWSNKC